MYVVGVGRPQDTCVVLFAAPEAGPRFSANELQTQIHNQRLGSYHHRANQLDKTASDTNIGTCQPCIQLIPSRRSQIWKSILWSEALSVFEGGVALSRWDTVVRHLELISKFYSKACLTGESHITSYSKLTFACSGTMLLNRPVSSAARTLPMFHSSMYVCVWVD